MKILMVSAELFPFAKTGGLADAVAALSKALSECGNEVKIIIPRYYKIDRTKLSLHSNGVCINMGNQDIVADFYTTTLADSNVTVYFVDYEKLYGREGIYGSCVEPDYFDNPIRFSLLARAAFALCENLNWIPDIIHSHDWSSCLVPVLLKYYRTSNLLIFRNTESVLTIHNMGYQGKYHFNAFKFLGLPDVARQSLGFEQFDFINFLKAGITCADFITTVSPTYSNEIKTPLGGFGLDGLIRVRSDSVFGILNGADTTEWNPISDKYLPKNYSVENISGKRECKKILQKKFSIPINEDVPIIGMVTRLAEQKGISEVFSPMYGCMYRMCFELKAQFVIVGSGDSWCEKEIKLLTEKLPNLGSYIGYNEEMSRLVEAGSDFFLMPSKYEPCGLNQIYSMLYGTIPIVRYTGGLADTIEKYDEISGTGTGFIFYDLTPDAIFNTVKYAIKIFNENKAHYRNMQQKGMRKQFLWTDAAKKYLEIYKK